MDKRMGLTDDQLKAVRAPSSVVVTAGAGTGKTAMLAERFLHHITADGMSPLEIVAVTFTEKAADELRSRIRKAVSENTRNDEYIAEVDAAQISTIHALCSRICRDFYDVAGIPADFTVLDEINAELELAARFEEVVAEIEPEIVTALGYGWLCAALRQLLKDPESSTEALEKTAAEWERSIIEERERALGGLMNCSAWQEARANIGNSKGAEGDRLEVARQLAINAIADAEAGRGVGAALGVLNRIDAHLGQNGNWPNGTLAAMRGYLRPLKQAVRDCYELASLEFTSKDVETAEAIGLLRRAITHVRERLAQAKLEDNVLDYSDLELYALKVLKNTSVREHYAARWRAFLVDEFQDTSPIQAEILELLTADAKLTIVGDKKQAIYGFRNADVELFDHFHEKIIASGGIEVPLQRSFRVNRPLVTKLNRVFAPVLGDLHQELEAHREESAFGESCVAIATVEDVKDAAKEAQLIVEAKCIAEQIGELIVSGSAVYDKEARKMRPVRYSDIAVLTRTWAPIDVYSDVLAASGIPAVNVGGGSLLDTREAKDGIAMLGFLADPCDDLSLAAVLRAPFFAVDDRTLFEFAKLVKQEQTWWGAMQETGRMPEAARILVELLHLRRDTSAEGVLRKAGDLTGYAAVIANLPHGARREADWRGFISLLRQLDVMGHGDVFGAMRHLRQLIAIRAEILRPPLEAGGSVSLMSIHRSKGLEWPVVFVADLARPNYGSGFDRLVVDRRLGVAFNLEDDAEKKNAPAIYKLIKKRADEREEAEARRILYVAMTRAGDKVFVTATSSKGPHIELLAPGIEAAGIAARIIPFTDDAGVPPAPLPPDEFAKPEIIQPQEMQTGLKKLPVTAISVYASCPRKFWYRFVAGHPGLGVGDAKASRIGTLTHLALEHDIEMADDLARFDGGASAEELEEAVRLAGVFRSSEEFSRFRGVAAAREVRFVYSLGGILLHGTADIVGEDFVLDHKTSSAAEPAEHVHQLSLYSGAFGKPRAFISFLRQGVLHEFTSEELESAGQSTAAILDGIASGRYEATPSQRACVICTFSSICSFRHRSDLATSAAEN